MARLLQVEAESRIVKCDRPVCELSFRRLQKSGDNPCRPPDPLGTTPAGFRQSMAVHAEKKFLL